MALEWVFAVLGDFPIVISHCSKFIL